MMKPREIPFLQEKYVGIIGVISGKEGPTYVTEISREAMVTYAHTWHLVEKLERTGILATEKVGRQRAVELTEIGKALAERLGEVFETMRFADVKRRIEEFMSKLPPEPEERREEVVEQLKNFRGELKSFARAGFLKKFRLRLLRRLDRTEKAIGAPSPR